MAGHALLVVILVPFFMSVQCQRGNTADFVRHPVDSGFSYYVSIRTSLFETHHCGGTLIAPSWVLTSAWCMDRGEQGSVVVNASVYIGAYELETEAATKPKKKDSRPLEHIDIEEVILHEKYSNASVGNPPYEAKYDIALLKLKTQSKNYSAVSLDIEGITGCCEDEELWNVGFGRKRIAGSYAINREAARFPFLSYNSCRRHFLRGGKNKYFQEGKNLTRTHSLCVENPRDQCNLDLGSPLVVRRQGSLQDRLVGFVTGATGECSFGGDPFVFGNLNGYMEWIVSFEEVLADISRATAERRLPRRRGPNQKSSTGLGVRIENFPYPVSISNQGTIGHICGGAVISPYHVITAASCVSDPRTTTIEAFTITIGSAKIPADSNDNPEVEVFEVNTTNVILREKNGKQMRDVAIVRLPGKSKFSPAVIPQTIRNCCDKGTRLTALGWGSKSAARSYSTDLHATRLTFVPFKECKRADTFRRYPKTSFCSGNEVDEGAMCSGDMGNPIVLAADDYDVLIGVATPEVDLACETAISQFYKVTYLRNWINKVIDED